MRTVRRISTEDIAPGLRLGFTIVSSGIGHLPFQQSRGGRDIKEFFHKRLQS
jgi:hypothetical protein